MYNTETVHVKIYVYFLFNYVKLRPLGCNLLPVETDHHGMIPSSLTSLLSHWPRGEAQKDDCTAPRVLYTIPNGVNPTGATMTLERKQEIYEVRIKHLYGNLPICNESCPVDTCHCNTQFQLQTEDSAMESYIVVTCLAFSCTVSYPRL